MKIFCTRKHDKGEHQQIWAEAKRWYEIKLKEEKSNIVATALGKLNDMSEEIGFSVRVETDDSKVIKRIMTKMEHEVANALIGKAKQRLLALLNQ